MKKCILLLQLVLVTVAARGQFSVNSTGLVMMDGYQGYFSNAPRVSIASNRTDIQEPNTGLLLINTDLTSQNWLRAHFVTYNGNSELEDFVSFCTQFCDRQTASKSADFHIATLNQGTYASRFAILSTPNANNVAFHFNTGYTGAYSVSRGIWMDASMNGQPTFRPDSCNYGSIGSPSHYWKDLYVNNAYYLNHGTITSDRRSKDNIRSIGDESLEKILRLNAVEYTIKGHSGSAKCDEARFPNIYGKGDRPHYKEGADEFARGVSRKEREEMQRKIHYGFVAQEVEEILPEVVEYNEKNDSYGIRYTELIPYLVAAIQAQQSQIEELKRQLSELKSRPFVQYAPTMSTSTNDMSSSNNPNTATLYPCQPNPTDEYTGISFLIPSDFQSAKLYVYNLSGVVLVEHVIVDSGFGSFQLNTKDFAEGTYLYSLYVNGEETNTKKLIIKK